MENQPKNQTTKVVRYNDEHVLYRRVDGMAFIGMATLFNEIQIRNLLPYDEGRIEPLGPGEKPKPWVWDFIQSFERASKQFLMNIVIH
jgi:hypothetical protein